MRSLSCRALCQARLSRPAKTFQNLLVVNQVIQGGPIYETDAHGVVWGSAVDEAGRFGAPTGLRRAHIERVEAVGAQWWSVFKGSRQDLLLDQRQVHPGQIVHAAGSPVTEDGHTTVNLQTGGAIDVSWAPKRGKQPT